MPQANDFVCIFVLAGGASGNCECGQRAAYSEKHSRSFEHVPTINSKVGLFLVVQSSACQLGQRPVAFLFCHVWCSFLSPIDGHVPFLCMLSSTYATPACHRSLSVQDSTQTRPAVPVSGTATPG